MTIYYDDLVVAGTNYRPPSFGQNASPGWADDIVYVAPFISGITPPVPPTTQETPSGGYERKRDVFNYPRAPTAEEIRKSREDWGILPRAAEIIGAVAKRQAEELGLDAQQRLEELERELEAANIEWESRFLTALNVERERLISEEIGARLQLIQDNRTAAITLLLLAL